jgi:hypothetical protein
MSTDDASRLSIMAAAVEYMRSADADERAGSPSDDSSPSRRAKLVLPNLTPAMQQDLALSKGAAGKNSKPLSIGNRAEYVDYPLKEIVSPHANDVLCGRGGGSNNHPGNESFRELVNEVKFPYVNCPKREKPLIARRIVEAVRNQTPPGRFLSKDTKTGLWNDIGDGKAREKTSQALREGAPIIRDMIGKPTSPTNVAHVLKEAKKAERAEKEYCVKLPKNKRSPSVGKHSKGNSASDQADQDVQNEDAHPQIVHDGFQEQPAMKRGKSMGNSPTFNHSAMPSNMNMPPFKKARSMGQKDHMLPNHDQQQHQTPSWHAMPNHHQSAGRNFNMMPYGGHAGQHSMMGGYPGGYAGMQSSRYPTPDSVPTETVRRLLLGQLDPVQLALQILPPEEAAIVARRHASSGLAQYHAGGMMGHSSNRSAPGPIPSSTQPLSLAPMVSDGSSTSSESAAMRRTQSDATVTGPGGGCGDDGSSVGSKQSNTSERALPKKKRKIVM